MVRSFENKLAFLRLSHDFFLRAVVGNSHQFHMIDHPTIINIYILHLRQQYCIAYLL